MKIIIAYASAGAGHRKAAEALYFYFKDKDRESDIKLIDVLEKTNFVFKNIYIYGYLFLINHAKWLWKLLFWITAIKRFKLVNSSWSLLLSRLNTHKFAKILIKEQPDLILSTHFLPPEIAAYLKRKQKIKSKIVTVVTDFGVHPFWVSDATDIYVVASTFTKKQLIEEGISPEKIQDFGIPIDAKFTKQYEKNNLLKKFSLESDKFTLLITTGSSGIGPIEKIIESLHQDNQIIVVCANNKKLYNRLTKLNFPGVRVFGFIKNIEEVMAAADIVIAKPGGLTTSEILSMELVPIFISPIPGQEIENLKAMEEFGIGKYVNRVKNIKAIVLDYKEQPDKLNKIKSRIRDIKKPFAVRDIYNALC